MARTTRNTAARKKTTKTKSATTIKPTDDRPTRPVDVEVDDFDDDEVESEDSEDDESDEHAHEKQLRKRGINGSAIATEDPVRMYLMQMGEIPMLNRAEEIDSAKRIEATRLRFRHCMLATDFVLQGAVSALEKVFAGELRLDRTVEV